MASKEPPERATQYCSVECECGEKIGSRFGHYDKGRCQCGRTWWALQPKRNGPLKLFPWPGFGNGF